MHGTESRLPWLAGMKKKRLAEHTFNNFQQPPGTSSSLEQLLARAIELHQRNNFQQAGELYRRILQVQPGNAYVLNLLGVLTSQHEVDHEESVKLIKSAINIDPDVPDYHNNLGLALLQAGKVKEAAQAFEKATRLNPAFLPAWLNLGNTRVLLKDAEGAIQAFQKIIDLEPDYLPAINNLGNVYRELRRFDDALRMFNKVLELKPEFAEAWYNVGLVFKVKKDFAGAITAFDRAIALNAGYLRAFLKRANCRLEVNDNVGAFQDFDRALQINPRNIPTYILKATALRQLGRFDETEMVLRQALALDESALDAYLGLVTTKKYNEDDLAKIQAVLEESELKPSMLAPLYFSLGTIFDNRGEYEKAFRHFQKGNQLHRSTYEYDVNGFARDVSRLIELFDEDFIRRNRARGMDTDLPVFIVGMPRSGTTLIEQIIASHPAVHGAGELDFIGQLAFDLARRHGSGGMSVDESILPEDAEIGQLADEYLTRIRKIDGKALRITDKMPGNFMYLGLIAVLFPKARIIHCRRHPLDTCLSIYFQHFSGVLPYAYDLAELGSYYHQYRRMMAHWQRVLPGQILDMPYEELIRDLEANSRKLISHIHLPWDDRCLRFYDTDRAVKTASQWQVRQKLYVDSVGRWRHYEPCLQPLIEALGDVLEKGSEW